MTRLSLIAGKGEELWIKKTQTFTTVCLSVCLSSFDLNERTLTNVPNQITLKRNVHRLPKLSVMHFDVSKTNQNREKTWGPFIKS